MNDMDLAIRMLERGSDYSWYARVALVSGKKCNDLRLPYLTIAPIFLPMQPYVRQMSQRANNPTPSVELSNGSMPGIPSRTESEESHSVDGNKNRDDLYLFTRGQVFKKSNWGSPAPPRTLAYPGSNAGILKLPAQSYGNYSDSGYDAPNLTMLNYAGQRDGYPPYSSHGSSHGYHSASSTPAPHPHSLPSLDLFQFGNPEQLPLFGSTPNGTATVDGAAPADSGSWLQQFGVQDGPPIGYGR